MLRIISYYTNVYITTKVNKNSLMKLRDLLIHTNFLTTIFNRNSTKHHCQRKKIFYCHLNMKDITDADYKHAKRICKDFEIRHLGEYHNLYVQSETLLIADVFNNFWDMYKEI